MAAPASKPFTGSPLGIFPGDAILGYPSLPGTDKRSIFTSYRSGSSKHILRSFQGHFGSSVLSDKPHSNDVYDIRTSNIIDKLSAIPHMALEYSDFAYLKNFGVYPNNRLIIARRFPTPVVDDLYSAPTSGNKAVGMPLSTVIGYIGESDDFMKLSFSESWGQAEVSFRELLNDVGSDFGFKLGGGLGSILEGGINVVPLPGASLLLQRKIMLALGVFGDPKNIVEDSDGNLRGDDGRGSIIPGVPQGDPNLIKEAMQRTLIDENVPGAGLKCKVTIALKTVYEQKFIHGVDPTVVFMDIMNNVLNMGTSPASFYLGKQVGVGDNVSKFFEDFMNDPFEQIKKFITSLIGVFKDQLDQLDKAIKEEQKNGDKGIVDTFVDGVKNVAEVIGIGDGADADKSTTTSALDVVGKSAKKYVMDFIRLKYKVRFMGTINALTGGASTPWHITVGNPLRPIFCSGDMLCTGVDINLGPQLSFNDLPTFIEVTVNLTSARNIGLQEIFSKMNTGGIRDVKQSNSNLSSSADSFWNTDDFKPDVGKLTANIADKKAKSEALKSAGGKEYTDALNEYTAALNDKNQLTISNNSYSDSDDSMTDEEYLQKYFADRTKVSTANYTADMINPDINADESIVASGTTNESDTIRDDASVEAGENTTTQVEDMDTSTDAMDATIISEDTATWKPGNVEVVKFVTVNGQDYKIIITKSNTDGVYDGTYEDVINGVPSGGKLNYHGQSVNDLLNEIINDI